MRRISSSEPSRRQRCRREAALQLRRDRLSLLLGDLALHDRVHRRIAISRSSSIPTIDLERRFSKRHLGFARRLEHLFGNLDWHAIERAWGGPRSGGGAGRPAVGELSRGWSLVTRACSAGQSCHSVSTRLDEAVSEVLVIAESGVVQGVANCIRRRCSAHDGKGATGGGGSHSRSGRCARSMTEEPGGCLQGRSRRSGWRTVSGAERLGSGVESFDAAASVRIWPGVEG